MAEITDLVCDSCGTTERVPVFGWISLKPAKKSEVVSDPPAKGDFCSQACLTAYVARMSIQAGLDAALRDAPEALDAREDGAE